MKAQPERNEALVKRRLSSTNPNPKSRLRALIFWWVVWGLNFTRGMIVKKVPSDFVDDVCQDVIIALIVAINGGAYTAIEGTRFEQFASRVIRGQISRFYRDFYPEHYRHMTSLDEMSQHFVEDEQSFDNFSRVDEMVSLEEPLEELSSREKQILGLLITGLSMQEIALELEVSYDVVRRDKMNMIQKLHEMVTRDVAAE